MITAGSELDALIAKHVMGLETRTFADEGQPTVQAANGTRRNLFL